MPKFEVSSVVLTSSWNGCESTEATNTSCVVLGFLQFISLLFQLSPFHSYPISSLCHHPKSTNKLQKKYLILSGGLGGSPYVKAQLEAKYASTNLSIIQ